MVSISITCLDIFKKESTSVMIQQTHNADERGEGRKRRVGGNDRLNKKWEEATKRTGEETREQQVNVIICWSQII